MRFASGGSVSLGVTALAGVVLISGYAAVRWLGYFDDGTGEVAARPPSGPGVVDPLNGAILIEGGTFLSGSDDLGHRRRPGESVFETGRVSAPAHGPELLDAGARGDERGVSPIRPRARVSGRGGAAAGGECHLAGSHGLRRLRGRESADGSTVGVRGERARRDGSIRGATRNRRANGYTTVPATREVRSRSWPGRRAPRRKGSTTSRAM